MMKSESGQIDNVLVTIVSRKLDLFIDMRCPCHKPVELLGQEILLLLVDEFGSEMNKLAPIKLSFNNRSIPNGQCLASVGAWDGSYIYID